MYHGFTFNDAYLSPCSGSPSPPVWDRRQHHSSNNWLPSQQTSFWNILLIWWRSPAQMSVKVILDYGGDIWKIYWVPKTIFLLICIFFFTVVMAIGEWPVIINVQSGLSPGNHSVVITARDIIGLTADATLTYLLENEERARLNRMYNQYCIIVPTLSTM